MFFAAFLVVFFCVEWNFYGDELSRYLRLCKCVYNTSESEEIKIQQNMTTIPVVIKQNGKQISKMGFIFDDDYLVISFT